jgi:hypothetical protein
MIINFATNASGSISNPSGVITIKSGQLNDVVVSHEIGHQYGCRHGVDAGGPDQNKGSARGYLFKVGKATYFTLMRSGYAPAGAKFTGGFSNPNSSTKVGSKFYPEGVKGSYDCAAQLRAIADQVSKRDNKG